MGVMAFADGVLIAARAVMSGGGGDGDAVTGEAVVFE
jgi:hypothetical protein